MGSRSRLPKKGVRGFDAHAVQILLIHETLGLKVALIDTGQNGSVRRLNRFCNTSRSLISFSETSWLEALTHQLLSVARSGCFRLEVRMLSELPDRIFSSRWIYFPVVTAHAELGLKRRGFPLCETSLVCCPRLIQCAGYGSFVWLSDLLMNGANRSIGIGRMVVVLCSLEISFIVCKKRSCRAIGCAEIIDAACTSFSAA